MRDVRRIYRRGLWSTMRVALLGSALFYPALAFGQASGPATQGATPTPSPTPQPSQGTMLTEVVVTALKRATNIQQTPLSISAVTAKTLSQQNITSSESLVRVVPSLQINENSNGGSRVIIRNLYATGEPLVGLYYDEVPLSGTGGVANDAGGTLPDIRLFDVERVEVLRGPQGTLYGASSMGGTIRLIFAKPDLSRYDAAIDAQANTVPDSGAFGGQVSAMLNVPIIDGKVAARIVGFGDHTPGFIDNSMLGLKNLNSNASDGARLGVRIKPIESITLDLNASYQDRKGYGSSWDYSEYQLTGKKFDQPLLIREPQDDQLKLFSGTLRWDLGFATLTAVGSYSDRDLAYSFDYTPYFARYESVNNTRGLVAPYAGDPTKIPGYKAFLSDCNIGYYAGSTTCNGAGYQALINGYGDLTAYQPQSNKTSTEEIRLADDRHALKWTVGFFHSSRTNDTESILNPTNPLTGEQYYPAGFVSGSSPYIVGTDNTGLNRTIHDVLEQTAGFGEATLDVGKKLSLTAGVRYFDYKKATTSAVLVPAYIAGNTRSPPSTARGQENGNLLKFSVDYKFTRDFMAYASASQGYRPGGVNQTLGLPSYAATYASDSVWSYEAGVKTAWLAHKVVVNLDVFRMDWTNMQVSASYNNAFGFITNSSSPARIQGVEFDTAVYPIDRLALHVSGSYIDAELLADQSLPSGIAPCPVPFVPGTTGCATISAGKKGDPIPYSPKWTLQTGADYSTPLGNDLQLIYHADLSYRSSALTTYNLPLYAAAYPVGPGGAPGGAALYTLPGFATVGVRVGLEKDGGRWGVYLFANNLFDTVGLTSLSNGLASATVLGQRYNGSIIKPDYAVSTFPREIGVEFRARFQ